MAQYRRRIVNHAMRRTLDDFTREGLDALRERLRRSSMIRFLKQFDTDSGDYARERHDWVNQASPDDICKAAAPPRGAGEGRGVVDMPACRP